ncbi:hypothetical protein LY78DRAFT_342164 [Colletotrichum sublineola]|nr:hypothetical protein LY78DRAFT_342164 [Colletotrichum sublineola]
MALTTSPLCFSSMSPANLASFLLVTLVELLVPKCCWYHRGRIRRLRTKSHYCHLCLKKKKSYDHCLLRAPFDIEPPRLCVTSGRDIPTIRFTN